MKRCNVCFQQELDCYCDEIDAEAFVEAFRPSQKIIRRIQSDARHTDADRHYEERFADR